MYNQTHASTAPATNKSRRTPLCRCEVLQIIKLIDCPKDLTASKKQTNKKQNKNAEIKLDHPTRSGFIQSPNLRSLTSRTVHAYRTGLLAAILNLVSNS